MKYWLSWVLLFITTWMSLNFFFNTWGELVKFWHMSLAMALGSFVAGSTPMGGGTVGFPILVLLKDSPAELGRNFGFLIQSIGMTSATIFLLCRGTKIDKKILLWALPFSLIGLIIGTFGVAPIIPDEFIKLIFSCLWFSFAILTLVKNKEFCRYLNVPDNTQKFKIATGTLVGISGGITSSLTGVGIDMILYVCLVLLYRSDIKIAISTSIVVMSLTSVMGTLLHFYIGDLTREVFMNWLAASPIVLFGAPFGALIVSKISKEKLLYFVSSLCIIQFIWTLKNIRISTEIASFTATNFFVAFILFTAMYKIGKSLGCPNIPKTEVIKEADGDLAA